MKPIIKSSIEYKYYGPEPKIYNSKALSWYNHFADKKDFQKWFSLYLSKNKISVEIPERIPSYIGIISNFAITNRELPEDKLKKLQDFVSSLPKKAKTSVGNTTSSNQKPGIQKSIQDRIKDQVHSYCAIIDGEIDKLIDNKFISKFNIKKFSSDIKGPQAKLIKEFYIKQYNDTLIKDAFTSEGYSYMSKAELKIYQNFLSGIIKEMESREVVSKVVKRSPRKKKETPAYKKVQKLQYKKVQHDVGVVSIEPEKLIGCSTVILYNAKTASLHYLVSTGKFDVKGTSLIGLDEKKSFKIKLRKPKEFFDGLAGLKSIQNKIKKLTTKQSSVTARINKDCIIYKVF